MNSLTQTHTRPAKLPTRTFLGELSRIIKERLARTPLLAETEPPCGVLDIKMHRYTMHGVTMTFRDPRDGVQYELLLRPTPLEDYIPTEPTALSSGVKSQPLN